MIGKITKGKSFNSLVNYILDDKKNAELIDSQGILTTNIQDIARSFNIQSKMKPSLKIKVGHISLNFHKNDLANLTNNHMMEILFQIKMIFGEMKR